MFLNIINNYIYKYFKKCLKITFSSSIQKSNFEIKGISKCGVLRLLVIEKSNEKMKKQCLFGLKVAATDNRPNRPPIRENMTTAVLS